MIILIAVSTSWVLEAAVLYGTVTIYHRDLSVLEAVFANSVTVSGQIFQITPGGIANYESFLVFALRLFGITIQEGYTIAIVTHAVKFFFSYVAGIMAIIIYPIPFNTMLLDQSERSEGKMKSASKFEKVAARCWNLLNEGKPLRLFLS